LTSLGHDALNL